MYPYVCVGGSSYPLAQAQDELQSENLNHITHVGCAGTWWWGRECVSGGDRRGKVQLSSPSSSRSHEVQVQELGVVSVPRRGICTDAPGWPQRALQPSWKELLPGS